MNTIVCGKNAEFIRFLKEAVAPAQVRIAETVQEALKFAFKNEVEALFLLSDYDLSKNSIDEFSDEVISALATLIDKGNTKIYIENYSAFDARDAGILGFKKLTSEMPLGRTTIKLLDEFSEATGTQILQKRNGIFTPNKGLFKWFNNIGQSSAATVYLSDTSRCANCIYSIYTITGNEALKEALIRCGEAIYSEKK